MQFASWIGISRYKVNNRRNVDVVALKGNVFDGFAERSGDQRLAGLKAHRKNEKRFWHCRKSLNWIKSRFNRTSGGLTLASRSSSEPSSVDDSQRFTDWPKPFFAARNLHWAEFSDIRPSHWQSTENEMQIYALTSRRADKNQVTNYSKRGTCLLNVRFLLAINKD
jgi:hypothetical protein